MDSEETFRGDYVLYRLEQLKPYVDRGDNIRTGNIYRKHSTNMLRWWKKEHTKRHGTKHLVDPKIKSEGKFQTFFTHYVMAEQQITNKGLCSERIS